MTSTYIALWYWQAWLSEKPQSPGVVMAVEFSTPSRPVGIVCGVQLHHEVLPGIRLRAPGSATARLRTRLRDDGKFDAGVYKASWIALELESSV